MTTHDHQRNSVPYLLPKEKEKKLIDRNPFLDRHFLLRGEV